MFRVTIPNLIYNCMHLCRTFSCVTLSPTNWHPTGPLNSLGMVYRMCTECMNDVISRDTFKVRELNMELIVEWGWWGWILSNSFLHSLILLPSYYSLDTRECQPLEVFWPLLIKCLMHGISTSQRAMLYSLSIGDNSTYVFHPSIQVWLAEPSSLVISQRIFASWNGADQKLSLVQSNRSRWKKDSLTWCLIVFPSITAIHV